MRDRDLRDLSVHLGEESFSSSRKVFRLARDPFPVPGAVEAVTMNAGRSTKFRAAAAGVESTSATFLRSAGREESSPLVESPCYRDCALELGSP